MSPCNVPVQRARARHCAGFLCHCPMPCLHAVSPCHVPTQCPRAVSLCNVPPVQCPHAASLCSVPLQSPSKLPTPCPRTISLCTLPLQPPMRPCVTPTWLSLCPQGGVGDPGPEATVSLTAFVVVALHSTRVLLPPDSPDQQLLVCPHPLSMSPPRVLNAPVSPSGPMGVFVHPSCVPCGVSLSVLAWCSHSPMSPSPSPGCRRLSSHPCHIRHVPHAPMSPKCPPCPHAPTYLHVPHMSPRPSVSPHTLCVPSVLHVPPCSHVPPCPGILTSHVLVPQDKALSQASTFLRGHVETLGTFGTAITAYALALVDTSPPGPQPAVERLRRLARKAHGEHTAGSLWGHPNT